MACYHPYLMIDTGAINPDTGKRVMKFAGRFNQLPSLDNPDRDYLYMVPCNKCIGCRLDYAREWSHRMLLELADSPSAIYVTLTYDDEHLPISDSGYPTTCVDDCQKWMKKLRQAFNGCRKRPKRKIRYFLGAEYGPKNGRPHYHVIIFGLGFADFPDLKFYKYNKIKQKLYTSESFAKIWGKGFCTIGDVSKQSCGYVARYMLKKVKGFDKIDYDEKGIEPEFSLCSRRPGIGLGYLSNHPRLSTQLSVFDGSETTTFPIPKKLLDKVLELDEDQYHVLKSIRREAASSAQYLEFAKTDMEFLEYLDMKETEAYKRIKGVSAETRLDI